MTPEQKRALEEYQYLQVLAVREMLHHEREAIRYKAQVVSLTREINRLKSKLYPISTEYIYIENPRRHGKSFMFSQHVNKMARKKIEEELFSKVLDNRKRKR